MPVCSDNELKKLVSSDPVIAALATARPVCWQNPSLLLAEKALAGNPFSKEDALDAEARLERFAPYLERVFPETAASGGRIESELRPLPAFRDRLERLWGRPVPGAILLKMDSHLPVSGSIKARGGFYEVLALAEKLAFEHGLLQPGDSYARLAEPEARAVFNEYSLAVGSTGNLGLSVGFMGAALGFKCTVHMSAEARQWKKDLLRSRGVTVIEYAADYGLAVTEGRKAAQRDPRCHFVDDESSRDLFLGYTVAGLRLAGQVRDLGMTVDAANPMRVYLPCGVGGGPGGVAFGLKLAFGDAVSCYFAEPAHAPAVILGLATGLDDAVSARDLGLDGRTAADGLAVSRPSGLVCRAMRTLLDGAFTMSEDALFFFLHEMAKTQGVKLEPSALAGVPGILHSLTGELGTMVDPERVTHLVWATGGALVPEAEWAAYDARGAAVTTVPQR